MKYRHIYIYIYIHIHKYVQKAQQNKQLTHFLLAQTCCNDWQNMNGNITVAVMATAGSACMSVDLDLPENCPPINPSS